MDRMIVNLSFSLHGNLAEIKEWIDDIDSAIVVESKISQMTKFAKVDESNLLGNLTSNDCRYNESNKHYKRIDLKLNVPIEMDSLGRRMCPMNACAKYVDELLQCYKYLKLASNWAKKHDEPYELHKDELELTFWKPKNMNPSAHCYLSLKGYSPYWNWVPKNIEPVGGNPICMRT